MDLIKKCTDIEKKLFDLCQKVSGDAGLVLYDLEYYPSKKLLRIYILNEATNSALIEDCVKVDHALSPFIEQEEWIPSTLTLEVSSPGIYRSLKTVEHFKRCVGKRVTLILEHFLDPEKFQKFLQDIPNKMHKQKKWTGKLEAVSDEGCSLSFSEKVKGGEKSEVSAKFIFADIKKAHLDPELDSLYE